MAEKALKTAEEEPTFDKMNVRKLPTSKGIVPSFSKGGAGVVCGTMSQPMIKHIVYQLIWQTTPAHPLEKEWTSENHSKPIWQLADIHFDKIKTAS